MGTSRRDSSVSRGRHQLSNGGRQLDIKEEESWLFFDIAATCDRDVQCDIFGVGLLYEVF